MQTSESNTFNPFTLKTFVKGGISSPALALCLYLPSLILETMLQPVATIIFISSFNLHIILIERKAALGQNVILFLSNYMRDNEPRTKGKTIRGSK